MNALTDAGLMDAVGVDAGQVIAELLKILPAHCVLSRKEDTRPYECDGLSLYRSVPMAVVLPETEKQIQDVLITCR